MYNYWYSFSIDIKTKNVYISGQEKLCFTFQNALSQKICRIVYERRERTLISSPMSLLDIAGTSVICETGGVRRNFINLPYCNGEK